MLKISDYIIVSSSCFQNMRKIFTNRQFLNFPHISLKFPNICKFPTSYFANCFQNVGKFSFESFILNFFCNFFKIFFEFRNMCKFPQTNHFFHNLFPKFRQNLTPFFSQNCPSQNFSDYLLSKFPNTYFLKLFPKCRNNFFQNFVQIVCFETFPKFA